MEQGRLVLVGAPLGNTGDVSTRFREAVYTADIIAVEDTRRFWRLINDLGLSVAGRVTSFYEAVEQARIPNLIVEMKQGNTVALVTDAGMPSVSDPGYRLVQACVEADIYVTSIPGPSAVTTALAVSGLPSDRFAFEGFPPRKSGERHRFLSHLAGESRTMIFFESPRRAGKTLNAMAQVFGEERQAVVCRELTKTYEEIKRGSLGELANWAEDGLLGEVTIVVQGGDATTVTPNSSELAIEVSAYVSEGVEKKDALSRVAKRYDIPKRVVYDAVLAAKDPNP